MFSASKVFQGVRFSDVDIADPTYSGILFQTNNLGGQPQNHHRGDGPAAPWRRRGGGGFLTGFLVSAAEGAQLAVSQLAG